MRQLVYIQQQLQWRVHLQSFSIGRSGEPYTLTSYTHRLDAVECFVASRDLVVDKLMGELQLVENLEITPLILDSFEPLHFGEGFEDMAFSGEAAS